MHARLETSLAGRLSLSAVVLALAAGPLFAVEPGMNKAGGAAQPGAAAPVTPAPAAPGAGGGAVPGAGGQQDAAANAASVAASEGNWPCVQRKMHTIDAVAVWDGPSLEGLTDWFNDREIAPLVNVAVNRRTDLKDAEKAIEAYAKGLPEGERDKKLTLLFAGILQTANTQRNSIIGGIERYQKRQRENAKEVERQGEEIAKLEEKAPEDLTQPYPELDQARERYDWFARVFQERQNNIPIACELPTLIEQRVFAVARTIRAQMKS